MKFKILIGFIFIISLGCFAKNNYNVLLNPKEDSLKREVITQGEETLFILDYSNSMNEMLINKTKYELLTESIRTILSGKSLNNKIGVRVYGQRWGLTPMDACRATALIVPVGVNSYEYISEKLSKYKPRGMTPITYSLKQAIKKDFNGDLQTNKHIILITDGGENCDESPCTYAMELVKYRKDIKIDVIAFNMDNYDDLDQLECVAKVTKGKLYNAATKAELVRSINSAFKTRKNVDAKILY